MKATTEMVKPESSAKRLTLKRSARISRFWRKKFMANLSSIWITALPAKSRRSVIDTLNRYYTAENSNIHRGVHYLSERATAAYEAAREKIRSFINARAHQEIIFVRGTTEAINLVAQSYGRTFLKSGDEIIVSAMEHHSNIVPWQMLCEQVGARLRVIPISHDGEIVVEEYRALLNDRRPSSFRDPCFQRAWNDRVGEGDCDSWPTSAALPVFLDGAQAVPHLKVDVQDLGCDFYAFSGHKLFGPTGIGVLYGRSELLERMPPYQGGGDMISLVTFEKTHYNVLPYKFEAGTPHIAGGIGLGAAIDYLDGLDWQQVAAHEHDLLAYATERCRRSRDSGSLARRKKKQAFFLLSSIIFMPMTSGPFSIKREWRCAPAIIAPCR